MNISIPDPNEHIVFTGVSAASGVEITYYGFAKLGRLEYQLSDARFKLSATSGASASISIDEADWDAADTDELPSEVRGYVINGLESLAWYLGLAGSAQDAIKESHRSSVAAAASAAREARRQKVKMRLNH